MPRGPLYCPALPSHDTAEPTGVTGRTALMSHHVTSICVFVMSVSGCLFVCLFVCLFDSTLNVQWRQQCTAVTAWARDADCLQAVEGKRAAGYSVACCDVSAVLQHGAHELKTPGHYILPSGIRKVQRTWQFGRLVHPKLSEV